jgi:hypothetical protein
MLKVHIEATIPGSDVVETLLQLVRSFDAAHPGCAFKIGVDGVTGSEEAEIALSKLDPPFSYTNILKTTEAMFSEEERRFIAVALRHAELGYYEAAWRHAGPHGSNPNYEVHKALLALGERCGELAAKLEAADAT